MEWKCGKCGATAISKCPWERNIFIQERNVALLAATTIVVVKPSYTTGAVHEVTLVSTTYAPNMSKGEAVAATIKNLADFTPQEWNMVLCKHDWLIAHDEKVCRLGHEHGRIPAMVS